MIQDIIIIFWLHFIADFLLQNDYIGLNKSKNSAILLLHCFIYSLPFLWFGVLFSVINALCHFVIDFITSRITSKLHEQKRYRFLVNIIGLDQAMHMTTLVFTYWYLPKG